MKVENLKRIESALRNLVPDHVSEARSVAEAIAESVESDLVTKDYLDAKISDLKGDLKLWTLLTMVSLLLVQGGLILGGVYFLLQHYRP